MRAFCAHATGAKDAGRFSVTGARSDCCDDRGRRECAPVLKQADIGVSMGIRGTDVARDASDLMLLDDNFATIVSAIGEDRRQFANVKKFVRYLLSSNAGEVIALVVNIAIGGPLVFLATQILWMNLVTDGVTAVALGLEKSEPDQMQQPPCDKDTAMMVLEKVSVSPSGLCGCRVGRLAG